MIEKRRIVNGKLRKDWNAKQLVLRMMMNHNIRSRFATEKGRDG